MTKLSHPFVYGACSQRSIPASIPVFFSKFRSFALKEPAVVDKGGNLLVKIRDLEASSISRKSISSWFSTYMMDSPGTNRSDDMMKDDSGMSIDEAQKGSHNGKHIHNGMTHCKLTKAGRWTCVLSIAQQR